MKSRVGGALFALLFAVVFGAGGYVGISSIAGQLHGWRESQTWQSAPATILEAHLERSEGESTTHKATARYRYIVGSRTYYGTRIAFYEDSDNVGSWQANRYAQLAAAQRSTRPIAIWFDPANPEHSVIQRTPRWKMVAFAIPFATMFPMVSLIGLWLFVQAIRTPSAKSVPSQHAENPIVITSGTGSELRALWVAAIVVGLIVFPFGFVTMPDSLHGSRMWLLAMIFPLFSLVLIWLALSRTLCFLLNGRVSIAIKPLHPRLGEMLTVQATFSRSRGLGDCAMSLLCEKATSRGEDCSYDTVWRQEYAAKIDNSHAAAAFSLPVQLPISTRETGNAIRWRVLLRFPDGKDERSFDVAVQLGRVD